MMGCLFLHFKGPAPGRTVYVSRAVRCRRPHSG
jgi:hypothetical protein